MENVAPRFSGSCARAGETTTTHATTKSQRCRNDGGELPLPLRERVGVRGSGLSIVRNPSPGSHLTMRRSRSFASAFFLKERPPKAAYTSPTGGEVKTSSLHGFRIEALTSLEYWITRLRA